MASKNKGALIIVALAAIASHRLDVTPFCYRAVPRNYLRGNQENTNEGVVSILRGHCERDDCDNDIATSPNRTSPLIFIYTSRRKFIQYSMVTVTGATLASGVGATEDPNTKVAVYPPRASNPTNLITAPTSVPPFSTTRTYRNIVLSNGLKVVLVQDSLVQRSSVAMSIDGAGQFAEPEDIPGLAHLMEHLILSSTRSRGKNIIEREAWALWNKWGTDNDIISSRGEEDFEDWLSENDGESNAFTAPGFVCFHFDSPHEVRFVVCPHQSSDLAALYISLQ